MQKDNIFILCFKRNTDIETILTRIEKTLEIKNLSILKNKQGNPSIYQLTTLVGEVSISHTDNLSLYLFTKNKDALGIDIQPIIENRETVNNFLSEAEKAVISEDNFFLESTILWTYKEAFVKSIGVGFITHPKNICCANILHKKVGDEGVILYHKKVYSIKILERITIKNNVISALVIINK